MKKFNKIILSSSLFLGALSPFHNVLANSEATPSDIDTLINEMTLEEKVTQPLCRTLEIGKLMVRKLV